MSDTHWNLDDVKDVPGADVLIHAGDFLAKGNAFELIAFNEWLGKQPHKHKIAVAGNHDWCCERLLAYDIRHLFTNATYLCDSGIDIDGIIFYGTPYQPAYYNWAFNMPRGSEELRAKWGKIPDNTNVLITHSPPHGILDKANDQIKTGDEDLLKRIQSLSDLKLHVFGHIHESYGYQKVGDTAFVNASVCNIAYEAVNPIQVITI